jgi:hypothetical protein
MKTDMTSKHIRGIAEIFRRYAQKFEDAANELDETADFEICVELLHSVANLTGSLRLDLLLARPLREYQRELAAHTEKR